jgi:hypothetical protein
VGRKINSLVDSLADDENRLRRRGEHRRGR